MKKLFMAVILASLVLSLYLDISSINIGACLTEDTPYSLAFASIGANLLESRIDCWATLSTHTTDKEMRRLLLQITKQLDIPAKPADFNTSANDRVTFVRGNFGHGDGKVFLTMQSDGHQTYLLASVITQNPADLESYYRKVNGVLPVKAASLYTATLDGGYSQEAKLSLMNKLLKNLKAREVERYRDKSVISVTGFSPLIKNQPNGPGTKYNLQAAASYNETEDKTYIYLGIPLILGEY